MAAKAAASTTAVGLVQLMQTSHETKRKERKKKETEAHVVPRTMVRCLRGGWVGGVEVDRVDGDGHRARCGVEALRVGKGSTAPNTD